MIYEVCNRGFGIAARVVRLQSGRFSVRLTDTDAGEALPWVRIFANKADAIACADYWVNFRD